MSLHALNAISPVDGRYQELTSELSSYFSEGALMKYRLHVEIEYFLSLAELNFPQLPGIQNTDVEKLRNLYRNFTPQDALNIKAKEKITNHDVKALEYFLKEKLIELGLQKSK